MDIFFCRVRNGLKEVFGALFFIGLFFYLLYPHSIYATETIDEQSYSIEHDDFVVYIEEYNEEVLIDIQCLFSNDEQNPYEVMLIRNDVVYCKDIVIEEQYMFKDCIPTDLLVIVGLSSNKQVDVLCTSQNEFVQLSVLDNHVESLYDEYIILSETDLTRPTEDTFISLGGCYDIAYLLENYNAFCFDELEGSHIIGPVVVQNEAYRTTIDGSQGGRLIVSDYSEGFSSYIGDITVQKEHKQTEVGLNYFYDYQLGDFIAPTLYTKLDGNAFYTDDHGWYDMLYYVDDTNSYISPNNHGHGNVLQNDCFIDFDDARQLILEESKSWINQENVIEVSPDLNTGYLSIDAGYSYKVIHADYLRIIDIVFPDGYDATGNLFPYNTTIHIEEDSLLSSGMYFETYEITTTSNTTFTMPRDTYPMILDEVHQFFPVVLVNGIVFNGGGGHGDGFEFGDGSGVIFNMPNLNQNPIMFQQLSDILGHIVAPNNDFYNYYPVNDGVMWGGGNLNGCVIANEFHAGIMEMHMWPYHEEYPNLEQLSVPITISALKELINNDLSLFTFDFKIELLSTHLAQYIDCTFPIYTTSDSLGQIEFEEMIVNEVGQYVFLVSEVHGSYENIQYDTNMYKVVIVVENIEDKLVVSKTIYNQFDELNTQEILFSNEYIHYYDLEFYKVDALEQSLFLEGATFLLTNTVTYEEVIVTSTKEGIVYFDQLICGERYYLEEIEAPNGYYLIDGYWIIDSEYVDGEVVITIDQSNHTIQDISQGLIFNEKIDYTIPSTGGTGDLIYKQIGSVVIWLSLCALKLFYVSNLRGNVEHVEENN